MNEPNKIFSNRFFISDFHLDHANVLKYEDREFPDIDTMQEKIIDDWNSVTNKNSIIYVLGDFAYYPRTYTSVLNRLNGHVFLIKGNHDHKNPQGFVQVCDYKEISIQKQRIILFHYPIRYWNAKHYNSIMLHGHSHGKASPIYNSIDVGVDTMYLFDVLPIEDRYKPKSFEQIMSVIEHFNSKLGEDNGYEQISNDSNR